MRNQFFIGGMAFFLCLLLPHIAWGQKAVSLDKNDEGILLPSGKSWEEIHFREALMKGREYKKYYELINEEKKIVHAEDLIDFCKKNNYIWDENYETKQIAKFGDFATSVSNFKFIPESVFVYYVFDWTDRSSSGKISLKSKGTAYFFDPAANRFIRMEDSALWSGNIVDGFVDGTGAGIWQKDKTHFYYFCGTFQKGFPVGKAKFRIVDTECGTWGYSPREKLPSGKYGDGTPFREVELGEMHEGMATYRYLDNGEGHNQGKANELYGYVSQDGSIAITPTYRKALAFNGGRAAVLNDKEEDVYIDKTGQFVDYTESQKKIFADEKARQDKIKADEEHERLLAEEKAAEEKRVAEEKRLAYLKKIQPLMDKSKWQRGDRLCLEFVKQGRYITGTLEEWNGDKSKCRIKIVTSPNGNMSYNGDLLAKNNLIWIPTSGEGWHKALPEEIEAANAQDNSIPTQEIQQMAICPECGGQKYVERTTTDYFFGHAIGSSKKTLKCSRCDGTGFIMKSQTIKNF